MNVVDAAAVARLLEGGAAVEPLRRAFAAGAVVPPRLHLDVDVTGARSGTLLVMPAWTLDAWIGVKLAAVFPDNARHGLPTVSAAYVLLSARTGAVAAIVDGAALTLYRTAGVSALAATYLARPDARTLLVVGTGALVPYLARAHAAAGRYRSISVWGRSHDKAVAAVARIGPVAGVRVEAVRDLEPAVRSAEVISAATSSAEPLIAGEWLAPGTHLDLVGSFRPTMRECDDAAIRRARIVVDTRDALHEAGDLAQPVARGVIEAGSIAGDLAALVRGECAGRRDPREITLFKSVGTALADLALAAWLYGRV